MSTIDSASTYATTATSRPSQSTAAAAVGASSAAAVGGGGGGGGGGSSGVLLSPESSKPRFIHNGAVCSYNGSIFEKLQDPALYTGSHKYRFDENGRGRGIAGRDSTTAAATVLHFNTNKPVPPSSFSSSSARGGGGGYATGAASESAASNYYGGGGGRRANSASASVRSSTAAGGGGSRSSAASPPPVTRARIGTTNGDADGQLWAKNLRSGTHYPTSHRVLAKDGHAATLYRDTSHLGTSSSVAAAGYAASVASPPRQHHHHADPASPYHYHQQQQQQYSPAPRPQGRPSVAGSTTAVNLPGAPIAIIPTPRNEARSISGGGGGARSSQSSPPTSAVAAAARGAGGRAASPSSTAAPPPLPPPSTAGIYIQYEAWRMDEEGNMSLDMDKMVSDARKVEALHALRSRRTELMGSGQGNTINGKYYDMPIGSSSGSGSGNSHGGGGQQQQQQFAKEVDAVASAVYSTPPRWARSSSSVSPDNTTNTTNAGGVRGGGGASPQNNNSNANNSNANNSNANNSNANNSNANNSNANNSNGRPPAATVIVLHNKAGLLGYAKEAGTSTTADHGDGDDRDPNRRVLETLNALKADREREALERFYRENPAVVRVGAAYADSNPTYFSAQLPQQQQQEGQKQSRGPQPQQPQPQSQPQQQQSHHHNSTFMSVDSHRANNTIAVGADGSTPIIEVMERNGVVSRPIPHSTHQREGDGNNGYSLDAELKRASENVSNGRSPFYKEEREGGAPTPQGGVGLGGYRQQPQQQGGAAPAASVYDRQVSNMASPGLGLGAVPMPTVAAGATMGQQQQQQQQFFVTSSSVTGAVTPPGVAEHMQNYRTTSAASTAAKSQQQQPQHQQGAGPMMGASPSNTQGNLPTGASAAAVSCVRPSRSATLSPNTNTNANTASTNTTSTAAERQALLAQQLQDVLGQLQENGIHLSVVPAAAAANSAVNSGAVSKTASHHHTNTAINNNTNNTSLHHPTNSNGSGAIAAVVAVSSGGGGGGAAPTGVFPTPSNYRPTPSANVNAVSGGAYAATNTNSVGGGARTTASGTALRDGAGAAHQQPSPLSGAPVSVSASAPLHYNEGTFAFKSHHQPQQEQNTVVLPPGASGVVGVGPSFAAASRSHSAVVVPNTISPMPTYMRGPTPLAAMPHQSDDVGTSHDHHHHQHDGRSSRDHASMSGMSGHLASSPSPSAYGSRPPMVPMAVGSGAGGGGMTASVTGSPFSHSLNASVSRVGGGGGGGYESSSHARSGSLGAKRVESYHSTVHRGY